MANVPVAEEQVTEDLVILNFDKVGLTDDKFVELCSDNRDFQFELTAQKELLIMTPPGPRTGRRNTVIIISLGNWARQDGTGVAFATGTIFNLPNGAKRGPDAAWLRCEKWDALSGEEQEKLPVLCPDFVVELMSPSDRRPFRFRLLQAKMDEYISNGTELGWLIDPFQKKVYIYRSGKPVECLENPASIHGDPTLPGFVLDLTEIL